MKSVLSLTPPPSVPEVRLFEGAPGAGKTAALIDAAAQLVADGADPARLLFLAATPEAAQALQERLAAVPALVAVPVSDYRAAAQAVLTAAAPDQAALSLPAPMHARDYPDLIAALKPSKVREERLHEMLRFFFRCFSEMADDDPSWLVTHEERITLELLRQELDARGVMLDVEASPRAVRLLRDQSAIADALAVDHVLADDFHLLDRATQLMSCHLAQTSLSLALDATSSEPSPFSFPYAKGPDEIVAAAGSCTRTRLAAPSTTKPGVRILESPEAELAVIIERVQSALADGAAPADLCVAAPNELWALNTARALADANIPVDFHRMPALFRGDFAREAPDELFEEALDRLAEKLGEGGCVPGVAVRTLDDLHGRHFQLLIASGMVNGLFPSKRALDGTLATAAEREKLLSRGASLLASALVKGDKVEVFAFQGTTPDTAQRLGLKVDRIRLVNGQRRCQTSPSVLLAALEA